MHIPHDYQFLCKLKNHLKLKFKVFEISIDA